MPAELRLERVDDPSDATRVWHFDELSEDAQDYLSAASREEPPATSPDRVAAAFEDVDVVKFTDYYRVERS